MSTDIEESTVQMTFISYGHIYVLCISQIIFKMYTPHTIKFIFSLPAPDDERVSRADPVRCKTFWLVLAVTWLVTAGAFSPNETVQKKSNFMLTDFAVAGFSD